MESGGNSARSTVASSSFPDSTWYDNGAEAVSESGGPMGNFQAGILSRVSENTAIEVAGRWKAVVERMVYALVGMSQHHLLLCAEGIVPDQEDQRI